MKKILGALFVLATSFYGARAACEMQQNNAVAINIAKAFEKAVQSREFLEWQIDGIKHLQKGLAIAVKQAKPHMSAEEQAAVKTILLACSDLFELTIKEWAELQLCKTPSDAMKIWNKYGEKTRSRREAVEQLIKMFYDLPLNDEVTRGFAMGFFALMQRLSTAMSIALPIVADELKN